MIRRSLISLGLLIPGAALATDSYTFCFRYDTASFIDRSTGDYLLGIVEQANGAQLRLVRNSNNDTYDFTLGTDGCTTLNLAHEAWTVKLRRTASVNGNTIEVRDDTGGGIFSTTVDSSFTPVNNGSNTWTVGGGGSGNVQIMAAATVALAQHNGGMSGETFSFRNGLTNCDDPEDAGCFDPSTATINVGSDLWDYKFGIGHEMGHAMTWLADQSLAPQFDYDADPSTNPCPDVDGGTDGHSMPTKEFQSAAAVEGIADFYSAIAFNDDSTSDCEIRKSSKKDWNHNQNLDPSEPIAFSCEDGISLNPVVPDADYLGGYDSAKCLSDGHVDNRGTEYDWLRALWDFHTDYGYTYVEILDIWNFANPHSWNANGNGTGGAYPAARMASGAATEDLSVSGIYSDWVANAATNGIDR